jgi:membrane protease YdiL (CAAX protease family)
MRLEVSWRFKDLLLVSIMILLLSFLAIPLGDLVFRSEKGGKYLFLLSGYVLALSIPVLWIRKYYKARKEMLGIRIGRWPVIPTFLLGIGTGVGYFLIESALLSRLMVFDLSFLGAIIRTALWIFSFHGFITFVLAPISEEVYFRGFLYGYLRSRLGIKSGLLTQALIFSLFHISFLSLSTPSLALQKIAAGLGVGFLCGLLYETSWSLLCPIVYHSTLNFMVSVLQMRAN